MTDYCNRITNCVCPKHTTVVPENDDVPLCVICFEEGKLRPCCKVVYCDYDYSKNNVCPNCKNETKVDKRTGAVFKIHKFSGSFKYFRYKIYICHEFYRA